MAINNSKNWQKKKKVGWLWRVGFLGNIKLSSERSYPQKVPYLCSYIQGHHLGKRYAAPRSLFPSASKFKFKFNFQFPNSSSSPKTGVPVF